jgi:hypothetical protein
MLDVSRGKVPTLDTLRGARRRPGGPQVQPAPAVRRAHLRLSQPSDIGAGTDPLTAEDILVLDAYCRARHVELIPNLQSFGHQRHLLSLPQHSHLDEVGWRWSLDPR